jgi:hypothetical protein
MEAKKEALLAEELGSLYSNSNIFVFLESKMQELTPSSNQNKIERNLLEILMYLPHTWSLHC